VDRLWADLKDGSLVPVPTWIGPTDRAGVSSVPAVTVGIGAALARWLDREWAPANAVLVARAGIVTAATVLMVRVGNGMMTASRMGRAVRDEEGLGK